MYTSAGLDDRERRHAIHIRQTRLPTFLHTHLPYIFPTEDRPMSIDLRVWTVSSTRCTLGPSDGGPNGPSKGPRPWFILRWD